MKLALAFLAVVAIWSTTPLAIKWSTETVSFITGVSLRMTLGAAVCLLVLVLRGGRLQFGRQALASYAASVLGVFGAMSLVYLAVQTVPSGVVSVVFGTAPILSGLLAYRILGESAFSAGRLVALMLSLGGLMYVFRGEMHLRPDATTGLIFALLATFLFCLSSVLVKRTAARMDPLAHTTGSLLLSLPLFGITWLLVDGQLPSAIGWKAGLSIVYLGVVGSVIGFVLYLYILQRMAASKVALVPLITPVFALMLGAWLAGETVSTTTLIGAGLILCGLGAYQFADREIRRPVVRKSTAATIE